MKPRKDSSLFVISMLSSDVSGILVTHFQGNTIEINRQI